MVANDDHIPLSLRFFEHFVVCKDEMNRKVEKMFPRREICGHGLLSMTWHGPSSHLENPSPFRSSTPH